MLVFHSVSRNVLVRRSSGDLRPSNFVHSSGFGFRNFDPDFLTEFGNNTYLNYVGTSSTNTNLRQGEARVPLAGHLHAVGRF